MSTIRTDDGLSLHFEYHGADQGETPLVFLNGMTQTTRHWRSHVRAIKSERPVLTYDARGQGQSDDPDEIPTLRQHADDLAAILDELDLSRVDLAGFSHGSRVALGLAVHHPQRLRRLVLCSATAEPTALARTIIRSWHALLRDCGMRALSWASLTTILGTDFLDANEALLDNIVQASVDRNSLQGTRLLLEGLVGFPDVSDLAPRVQAPTLVLSADQDPLVEPEGARQLADLCGGHHHLIEDCGHTIPIERPRQFRRHLLDFLADS